MPMWRWMRQTGSVSSAGPEGAVPGDRVLVVGVDQGAVDVEDRRCGHSPELPDANAYHSVNGHDAEARPVGGGRGGGGPARQHPLARSRSPTEVLRDVLAALLAEGHVLIEDHPGSARRRWRGRWRARSTPSTRASSAPSTCCPPTWSAPTSSTSASRGSSSIPGPVFANVVLVDEVNRASPKTQSGLLECMQERRVTVEGQRHELARPFLVIATQNPVEYEGTYPLPEAQVDRFMVRRLARLPGPDEEAEMLAEHAERDRVLDLRPVAELASRRRTGGGRRTCTRASRCGATSSISARRPARTPGSSSAPARGRGCCCSGPRRRWRRWTAATTPCPTTSRRWPTRCSSIVCCCVPAPGRMTAGR